MANVNVADIQAKLAGVTYPARRDNLVTSAQSEGAEEELLDALRQLPDREYEGPADVMAEFGGEEEPQ